MRMVSSLGNYIAGRFHQSHGDELISYNPAYNQVPVFKTHIQKNHVDEAVIAAQKALRAWSTQPQEVRNAALLRLKDAFIRHENSLAEAISLEMGKPLWEALGEAKNLSARISLSIEAGLKRVATEHPQGVQGETRYHAQGILAVLGPYNFPAHLVNAHVIPALLTGNCVIVKPSELCPLVGQIYAQCVHEAQLPSGVFNLVQGRGDIGQALVMHPACHGVLFTGSYTTGRAIAQALLDQPHKIAALEMGGKNCALVLDDADLQQALIEVVQGAFLTTGQRCTATSRVFVHTKIADAFINMLHASTKFLRPQNPFEKTCPFGPLASHAARARYLALLSNAQQAGAEVLLAPCVLEQGAFVTPSLHLLTDKNKGTGYTDTELFGPDICIEIIDDLDDGIARINQSPYGLSNAIFTRSQEAFEHLYYETRCGVLNFNKSTNAASGYLPFGGIGKSGNQRAAGIDAVRYTTFPVAINLSHYGDKQEVVPLKNALHKGFEAQNTAIKTNYFSAIHIEALTAENFARYEKAIAQLEEEAYEEGRRDTLDYLRDWLEQKDSLGLIMLGNRPQGQDVLGFCIGGPLEHSQADGPLHDPMRGKHNTFYSTNVLISPAAQGFGLGHFLKETQLRHLKSMTNPDNTPRYLYATGRNRIGFTPQIMHINRQFGAEEIATYDGQYGDKNAQALYYRIDLSCLF